MIKTISIILVVLMMMVSVSAAQDKEVPFLFSILSPLAFPMDVEYVNGFRFNLFYGNNKNVDGVDIGLIQQITEKGIGTQFGGVNITNKMDGSQIGLIGNRAENIDGPQFSIIFNYAGKSVGSQLSLINRSNKMDGMQLGLFNFTDKLDGTQIGLLNFANGKVMPFYQSK